MRRQMISWPSLSRKVLPMRPVQRCTRCFSDVPVRQRTLDRRLTEQGHPRLRQGQTGVRVGVTVRFRPRGCRA